MVIVGLVSRHTRDRCLLNQMVSTDIIGGIKWVNRFRQVNTPKRPTIASVESGFNSTLEAPYFASQCVRELLASSPMP